MGKCHAPAAHAVRKPALVSGARAVAMQSGSRGQVRYIAGRLAHSDKAILLWGEWDLCWQARRAGAFSWPSAVPLLAARKAQDGLAVASGKTSLAVNKAVLADCQMDHTEIGQCNWQGSSPPKLPSNQARRPCPSLPAL